MILTVPVKLFVNETQKQTLLKTMYDFNSACDFISSWAFAERKFGKHNIQKAIYHEVRSRFNLSSQFAIRAIAKVANSYKTDKTVYHQFRKQGCIEFDARLLSWQKLETVSLSSSKGRLKGIRVAFGDAFKLPERKLRASAKLRYENGNFFLDVATEVPEAPATFNGDFFGVDTGIINLATLDNGVKFIGDAVEKVRLRFTSLRKRLQKRGTKSAKRHLKRISKQERNFKRNTNHIISKQIVSEALKAQKTIAMENLHQFRKTVRKEDRDRHGKWAFAELLSFTEYKAKIAGAAVVLVDPRYTSQTCSNCGHCEKANRHGEEFKCKSCGHAMHSDENAAINIRNRAANALLMVESFTKLIDLVAPVNEPIVAIERIAGSTPAFNRRGLPPAALISCKPTTLVVGD